MPRSRSSCSQGKNVQNWVKLTPLVWVDARLEGDDPGELLAEAPPTYSARLQIKPWTTYTTAQLTACKGP